MYIYCGIWKESQKKRYWVKTKKIPIEYGLLLIIMYHIGSLVVSNVSFYLTTEKLGEGIWELSILSL